MAKKAIGGVTVQVEVLDTAHSPKRLFERAQQLQGAEQRAARAQGDSGNVYDRVWVVTDVDDYAKEIESLTVEAVRAGITLAVSNPCFEVWMIAHCRYSTQNYTSKSAQKLASELGLIASTQRKSPNIKMLEGHFVEAEEHAHRLRKHHANLGSKFPNDNPSTGVNILIRSLLDSAQKSTLGKTIQI
ncbi:MAG: RloB family protein [Microbacteriaceae bacterium]